MFKDGLQRDSLISGHEHLGNEVFGLLANLLELRNCIMNGLLSREYFMVLTERSMSLSLSPSKGGAAESKM
jgi:hypothetical protein